MHQASICWFLATCEFAIPIHSNPTIDRSIFLVWMERSAHRCYIGLLSGEISRRPLRSMGRAKNEQDSLVLVEDSVSRGGRSPGHALESQELSASAPNLRSDTTPAPGQYVWRDDVHLRKKPVWSMTSPDRKNLDLMLPTWTPASGSLQPRAPDPGEYGLQDTCGRNGVYRPPKWSQARSSGRPCLAPDPPEVIELETKIPSSFGGENPLMAWPPKWSVSGKDRAQLPNDIATWTPKPNTDIRPGPGTYNLNRKSKWKATSRSGCTWGRRLPNLHPDVRAYITQTSGARMKYGDWMRYRPPEAG